MRTDGTHRAIHGKDGGDWVAGKPSGIQKLGVCVGAPTIPYQEKRTGSSGWQDDRSWNTSLRGEEIWREFNWSESGGRSEHEEQKTDGSDNPAEDNSKENDDWWKRDWGNPTSNWLRSGYNRRDVPKTVEEVSLEETGTSSGLDGEKDRSYSSRFIPERR